MVVLIVAQRAFESRADVADSQPRHGCTRRIPQQGQPAAGCRRAGWLAAAGGSLAAHGRGDRAFANDLRFPVFQFSSFPVFQFSSFPVFQFSREKLSSSKRSARPPFQFLGIIAA
jgi:hypothetical protein